MAPKLAALPRPKDLANLAAKDLKELCRKRELGLGGSKEDMVKRLVDCQKSIDKCAAKTDRKDSGKVGQKSLLKAPAAKADKKDSSALEAKTQVKAPGAKQVLPPVVTVPTAPKGLAKSIVEIPAQSSFHTAVLAAPSPAKAIRAPRLAVVEQVSQPSIAVTQPDVNTLPKPVVEKPTQLVVPTAASPAKPAVEKPAQLVVSAGASATQPVAPPPVSLEIASLSSAVSPVKPSIAPQVSSDGAALDKTPATARLPTTVMNQSHGSCIVVGGSAELMGLKGQAHLNGERAEVLEWLKQAGRWRCRVARSGEVINCRPRNLEPVGEAKACPSRSNGEPDFEGQCVVVRNLESKPELVGERAEVLQLLEEKGRWRCQLVRGDEQFNFKPQNIALWEPPVESEAKRPRTLH